MARFFIDRPVFAWVIAIIIMLAGGISILNLPADLAVPVHRPADHRHHGAVSRRVRADRAGHRHAGYRTEHERP